MLVPVIDYADRYDSEAVIKLAECIDSFEVFGNVSTAYDLGLALINDNPYYELHPDIEDYFDFAKYGEDMKNVVNELKKISEEAEELLESKKTLSKADREKILSAFHKVQIELGSNMPFLFSQFNRQMEKTVTEAKAEVEGHIQSRLQDMALRGMQLENAEEHMPVIEESYNAEEINEETAEDFEESDLTEDEGMQMGGM